MDKIDIEKYKHNNDYRQLIQNKFKTDLVQPYTKEGNKNPEFIKRHGEEFYKPKKVNNDQEEEQTTGGRKRVILGHSRGSRFAT